MHHGQLVIHINVQVLCVLYTSEYMCQTAILKGHLGDLPNKSTVNKTNSRGDNRVLTHTSWHFVST